jgi:hypothetical protein
MLVACRQRKSTYRYRREAERHEYVNYGYPFEEIEEFNMQNRMEAVRFDGERL